MKEEIELKLALPAERLGALYQHPLFAAAEVLDKQWLDSTYYDTAEFALRAQRVALRIRRQGEQWLQTVKCAAPSTAGLSRRPEWEQPYAQHFDFSAIDDEATASLLRRHQEHLRPWFRTHFERETRRLRPVPHTSVLLMVDRGEISLSDAGANSPTATISELELELEHGAVEALLELGETLRQDLDLLPVDDSKAARGFQLLHTFTGR